MGSLQVYDIIILIIVGWLTLRGTMKGMVSQIASIAAVILSFWSAVRYGPMLEPVMRSTVQAQAPWDKVLAITIAFVGTSIAVMLLQRVLAGIISAIRLKKFDHLCGALFGFLKGVLIGMIITFFAVMLSEQTREMAVGSQSGKILVRLIQQTRNLLPEDISALVESNLKGFQEQIESGKETVEQIREVSQTGSEAKKGLEWLQNGLTNLLPKRSGETDAADQPPSLAVESEKDSSSPFSFLILNRPSTETGETLTGEQRIQAMLEEETRSKDRNQNRANQNTMPNDPIPMERFSPEYLSPSQVMNGNASPTTLVRETGSYTPTGNTTTNAGNVPSNLSGDFLLAPSAEMMPMVSPTSTANGLTGSSFADSESKPDWRSLMRNMR